MILSDGTPLYLITGGVLWEICTAKPKAILLPTILIAQMLSLPKTKDSYGLIHYDLDGYLSANPLSDYWLDKIPMFMKFRKICQFSWFYSPHNTDDLHNLLDCMEQDRLFADCSIDKQLFTNRFYQSANFAAQHHIAVYS